MIIFDRSEDLIAIVAPSSSTNLAKDKLIQACKILQSCGFNTIYDEQIFLSSNLPFVASSKENRLRTFTEALLNPQVKIIWSFRGGIGATELIHDLMNIKPIGDKILIGYSDITALHLLFNQRYLLPTIHGSVITSWLDQQKDSLGQIIAILSGEEVKISLISLNNLKFELEQSCSIIGGNLTVFCNMLATKLHPDCNKKILLFEDVNEKAYKIYRYLVHLNNAGIFENVAAVIFGDFIDGDEHIDNTILSFTNDYLANIPVYRVKGLGHGDVNIPVILGSEASIIDNSLVITSPFNFI